MNSSGTGDQRVRRDGRRRAPDAEQWPDEGSVDYGGVPPGRNTPVVSEDGENRQKEGRRSKRKTRETLNTLFGSQLKVLGSPDSRNETGAAGVAFVISKRYFGDKEVSIDVLVPGRAIRATTQWSPGKNITVLNVYAPNSASENADFWNKVQDEIRSTGHPKPDVILGDFNVVEDALDRAPAHPDPHPATEALASLMNYANMVDSWRHAHPTVKRYTFNQTGMVSQSRLDRIYLSKKLVNAAADWEMKEAGIQTDHQLVSLTLANYDAPAIGPGRWAMPTHLLSDKQFIDKMRALGNELQDKLQACAVRTEEDNPQTIFAAFKQRLVGEARSRLKIRASVMDKKLKELRQMLADHKACGSRRSGGRDSSPGSGESLRQD
ncbi:DNase I-like protein [Trametes versicolor FP-101664 SS1]|uniref:DNase I-like protein n=1 Tax=Trametes versicolor (strain FP-101664) TaxID=717944 RepID=UPI0004622342|nr:DNase I-like protein [Trametes versicolor FP-101664 SS1]EIW64288.1 DNase I-like protein [Trametes versicolor FP-101664 SS1]